MADPKPKESEAPPALDPSVLLIDAKEVVRRLNISGRTWYSLVSIQHAPQPIRLGRRTLWRVEELEEWVAVVGLHTELELADVVGPQDGLRLLQRLAVETLEQPHLGECVLDEVLQRLFKTGSGRAALGLERLTGDEVLRGNAR